jgi:hypothetical protein
MLAAPAAELFQLQPIRSRFTVLRLRIIPLFAITALHRNNFSGHNNLAPSSYQIAEGRSQNAELFYFCILPSDFRLTTE